MCDPKFSVQAAAFAKAISVDVQEVSVIERVSLDSMPVEDGYDGPRLEGWLCICCCRYIQVLHYRVT